MLKELYLISYEKLITVLLGDEISTNELSQLKLD